MEDVTDYGERGNGFRMDLIIFFQKSTESTDSGLYFFCWNLFPERGESVDSGDFCKKVFFFNQTRPGVLLCPTHAQHEDPVRLLTRCSGLRVPSRILRGCSLNNTRSGFCKRAKKGHKGDNLFVPLCILWGILIPTRPSQRCCFSRGQPDCCRRHS